MTKYQQRIATTSSALGLVVVQDGMQRQAINVRVFVAALNGDILQHRFTGQLSFSKASRTHLEDVVLPSVNSICEQLGLPPSGFEISIATPGALSATGMEAEIIGSSLDLPIFVAALSARLGLTVPSDTIMTGHIAARDGQLQIVAEIPAKLSAAVNATTVTRCIIPASDTDESTRILVPAYQAEVAAAIAQARATLQIIEAADLYEVIEALFFKESLILPALQQGWFEDRVAPEAISTTPTERIVQRLGSLNDDDFVETFALAWVNDRRRQSSDLLSARLQLALQRECYPSQLGTRLHQVLLSAPPKRGRANKLNRLLSIETCLHLLQYAEKADHEDGAILVQLAAGKLPAKRPRRRSQRSRTAQAHQQVKAVLEELSEETIAELVDYPIDAARETFPLYELEVVDSDAFLDHLRAFAAHIVCHGNLLLAGASAETYLGEGLEWLQRAFLGKKGLDQALSEARVPRKGGLRHIFDQVTLVVKKDLQTKYVNRILTEALSGLEWDQRVDFATGLLAELRDMLPPSYQNITPQQIAHDCETIVIAYVQGLNRLRALVAQY